MVAQVVIKAGLMAASIGLNAMRRIEGPRVDDLSVTSGDYGATWDRIWGTRWRNPPVIWAESLKEIKQTSKTKRGKSNDYSYFGSWMHGLACHELAGVRRIKFNGHLVYDASGAGPITPFSLGGDSGKGSGGTGGVITDFMRFYPGDFAQEVDPAIAADVDGRLGEGWTPAYRGRSILVFEGVPLDKFGNQIPSQVEVELVGVSTPSYPFESFATGDPNLARLWGATFSPDYSRFMFASTSWFEIWDVNGRAQMIAGAIPAAIQLQSVLGIYNSGHWLAVKSGHQEVYRFEPDGTGFTSIYTAAGASSYLGGVRVVADVNGDEHWCGLAYSSNSAFVFDGTVLDFPTLTGVANARVTDCFVDAEGSIWLAGSRAVVAGTTALFHRIVSAPGASGPGTVTVTGLPAAGGVLQDVAACHFGKGGADQFVFAWGTAGLYAADRATGTVLHSNTGLSLDPYNTDNQIAALAPGATSLFVGTGNVKEVSLADLSVIRTITMTNWAVGEAADGVLYVPPLRALLTAPTANAFSLRYLDRLGEAGVTRAQVIGDICTIAIIPAGEVDLSLVTGTVAGYSVSGGTGKDWLEPVLDLWDIDLRPHGFQLQFVPRGAAAVETISSANFARPGDDTPLFVASPESGATDLPRQVTMLFSDLAIEQQPNLASSPPLFDGEGQRSLPLDMTSLALEVGEARQLVSRFARRLRFDARSYSLALPLSRIDLEPGDVKALDLAGVTVTARLQSMVLDADRRIATEWKADDPSVALLDGAAGADADGHAPAEIVAAVLSKGFALDIPLLGDLDEGVSPVIYGGAAPYGGTGWTGAVLFRAQSGEYSDEVASVDSASAATWGYADDLLPDSPYTRWDRLSTATVVLQSGSLSGCTEADLLANPARNLVLWGAELVQFTTATLTGPNTYEVSGLLRGRRGTEWACAGHSARERFVLAASLQAVPRPLSEVGTGQSYKAVTNGGTESGTFPIDLDPFSGASKRPYAPCHLRALQDVGTGDWALSGVRRTRIGGAWTSGTAIPLGEASELYRIEIMDGLTVKRTFTGLTSPSVTYTSAQQTTDWGAPLGAAPVWRVCQISDAVGDGYFALAA